MARNGPRKSWSGAIEKTGRGLRAGVDKIRLERKKKGKSTGD